MADLAVSASGHEDVLPSFCSLTSCSLISTELWTADRIERKSKAVAATMAASGIEPVPYGSAHLRPISGGYALETWDETDRVLHLLRFVSRLKEQTSSLHESGSVLCIVDSVVG